MMHLISSEEVLEQPVESDAEAGALPAAALSSEPSFGVDGAGCWLTVERGQHLFHEGDEKQQAYRVESGIFCITAQRPVGPPDIVEMVFPGGWIGLGFLKHHIDGAIAVTTSRVRLVAFDELPVMCELSPELRDRQATAVEREFNARRRELTRAPELKPIHRVASFLLAIAQFDEREGRDAQAVTASLRAGDVARFLGLEIDALAIALAELQTRRLISRTDDGGLLLEDRRGLETLAGGMPAMV